MRTVALTAVAAMIALAASTALADVTEPTLRIISISPAVNLTVYHPFQPAGESFDVGVSNIMLDLPDGGDPPFQTTAFCIDLKQNASSAWKPYGLHPLEIAPSDGGTPYSPMGVNKAQAIRELWGEHYADTVGNDLNAAAFQASLWEIIYENSNNAPVINGWDLTSGNLSISDASVASIANTWLSEIGDQDQTLETSLAALTNYTDENSFQDLLFLIPGGNKPPVPEPITMATMAMGLSGLGLYVRRRTRA